MERAHVFVIGRHHSGAHQIQCLNTNQSEQKKNPPPMPQQKLPKVIREHLPPDFDLHEPTLISPKRCLSAFFLPH